MQLLFLVISRFERHFEKEIRSLPTVYLDAGGLENVIR